MNSLTWMTFTTASLIKGMNLSGRTPIGIQSCSISAASTPRRRGRCFSRSRKIRSMHGIVFVFELLSRRRSQARFWKSLCDADVRSAGSFHHATAFEACWKCVIHGIPWLSVFLPFMNTVLSPQSYRGGIQGTLPLCRCTCTREATEWISEQLYSPRRHGMA